MMVCDWHIIQLDRMSIFCIANYITLESFNANYIDLKIKHLKVQPHFDTIKAFFNEWIIKPK